MASFIKRKIFLLKIGICITFSILIFLSFRLDLIYDGSIQIFISFIFIQFIVWGILIFSKKKIANIIFYNLFFIILLNLFLTPLFHIFSFDIPTRQPNYKTTKEFKGTFFKDMISSKNFISYDEMGYRSNGKINYKNKKDNVIRIFTIGASTTEEFEKDDTKTWSSLIENNIQKLTNKEIEVINSGMAGLRAEHHFITLKRIKKYEPDFVIFLMGVNDWNNHIVNNNLKYLIPKYEIKYKYSKSILFNVFKNIKKQINLKSFIDKRKNNEKNITFLEEEIDLEAYFLPQINSLNKREIYKVFYPNNVSEDYKYWTNLIIKECKKKYLVCIFLDQPTAYKKNISIELKTRLWMTPPNEDYTLSLENLIYVSSMYNEWLEKKITTQNLNFCPLSDKIDPNTNDLFDDCHFTEKGSKKLSEVLTTYIKLNFKTIFN